MIFFSLLRYHFRCKTRKQSSVPSTCFGFFLHKSTCPTGQRNRPTIFALSTPAGISAVAIIRISGPNAQAVVLKMTDLKSLPESRRVMLKKIRDPSTMETLDKSLLLWFQAPNSYTGEDMCELHVHGGLAVIRTVMRALSKIPLFRHAEPGEFTKRAFMAGKLDLTEIEGLADLIHAQTEAQQRQALRQMEGYSYKLYSRWAERIKNALANIEAYIDFSEDQNLDEGIQKTVFKEVESLQEEMKKHLGNSHKGEKLRHGVVTVLAGRPNVGKSSLINALCQRDIAIVSPIPGTTRDIVESSVNLGGYLVHLSDTAGIRDCDDAVELEGVKRAQKRLAESDILILVIEAKTIVDAVTSGDFQNGKSLVEYVLETEVVTEHLSEKINHDKFMELSESSNLLLVLNKVDLLSAEDLLKVQPFQATNVHLMSCLSGSGFDSLLKNLTEKVEAMFNLSANEEPMVTRERHRAHIEQCLSYLHSYQYGVNSDAAIAAEDLRKAMHELGRITGRVTTEDILDVIFRDFCVGK